MCNNRTQNWQYTYIQGQRSRESVTQVRWLAMIICAFYRVSCIYIARTMLSRDVCPSPKWDGLPWSFVLLQRIMYIYSADYAVTRCLSITQVRWLAMIICDFTVHHVYIARTMLSRDVRPSHVDILSIPLNISSNFFLPWCTILVFPYQTQWEYSNRDPLTRASNGRGYEKIQFSTNISLYLRNDTRYSHSYYGMRIANLTHAFERYHFQYLEWHPNPHFKVMILFNIK